ncbi:MAG: metallophosphoesterase family protein [Verrucomicrobia bacterium]|nr:metallophosphoesterase family protein [Verrucomicrobiota bacterium]
MRSFRFYLLLCLLGANGWAEELPATLILTWEKDPCRSMTALWLRGPGLGETPRKDLPEVIQWKKVGEGSWQPAATESSPFPDPDKMGKPRWTLVKARWDRLEPGGEYLFKIGSSPEAKFCTAPQNIGSGVTFVEGGDIDIADSSFKMMVLGARQNPLFMSLGGDLAYGDGHDIKREIAFWKQWRQAAIAPDGRLIPLVPGIGNHEVKGGYVQEGATFEEMKARAPFFYAWFGGLYRQAEPVALDFGDYLSMLLLDSGHVLPIASQTGWLKENLEKRKAVPWVFASWHVSTYPSFRKWKDQKEIVQTREEWVPVLEQSGVAAVFTHHEHNLQRVESEGQTGRKIPVLGNGAMGVEARPQNCPESKALTKAFAQSDYLNVIQLRPKGVIVRSLGPEGEELDRVDLPLRAKP